tara:strand:+ start:260 stop:532 length:273 start_codon:yes stop_codon:yes gene_type:complete
MNIKRQWTIKDYSNPGGGAANWYSFECPKVAREFAEKLLEDGADRDDVFLINPSGTELMLKWQIDERRERWARGLPPKAAYFMPGGAGSE